MVRSPRPLSITAGHPYRRLAISARSSLPPRVPVSPPRLQRPGCAYTLMLSLLLPGLSRLSWERGSDRLSQYVFALISSLRGPGYDDCTLQTAMTALGAIIYLEAQCRILLVFDLMGEDCVD